MASVHFVNQSRKINISDGATILEAARLAGVEIEAPCNAVGVCGKCRVKLAFPEQLSLVKIGENHRLDKNDAASGWLLACQTSVFGNIDVLHKDKSDENRTLRILSEGETFDYALKPYISKFGANVYGGGTLLGTDDLPDDEVYAIAADIGTTTIVAELIHLPTGTVAASESMLNPQSVYAQDVLTRIHFATEEENGLQTLYGAFLSAFFTLRDNLTKAAKIRPESIYEIVYSGNTTMLHLAASIDPAPLGKYPYNCDIDAGGYISADALGVSPFGKVYLPPVVSAFVGADIVSGILASQLHKKPGVTLFIDVGTNGEMVLARNGHLAATSTAAGPAFEGMNISCGMRAAPGAVEQFTIDEKGKISFKTVGDVKASGICGSGLLDITSELARTGIMDESGRYAKPEKTKTGGETETALRERDGKCAFFITEEVFLTQKDIRQVQLAKGAIRAGITLLLERLGIGEEQVDEVIIAGSFGYHLREDSLVNLGMLPRSFLGKVRFAGNTSQAGAVAFSLNSEFRDEMKELAGKIEKIELADSPDFEKVFIASLGFGNA
ncbi:MAG: ASKHA domain-containing protein [Oscillospiraceae bacterium]|jgi:uncharacterized 2Fe-2S/4Fe-4S cluster protein (DUF4445 family)|nr:ASKHA domain-containing protein [Oscillospiraceae bacterium]